MPRTARFDAPGVAHHVMLRGIERREIFRDDADRRDFTSRLARILPETDVRCFGVALMPNHVHLVLQTGSIPLARTMARLATGYAVSFNRRHDRVGHLFQNRYKSVWIEGGEHLRTVIRYVHLNPLRAGQVHDLAQLSRYPWTGHAALMGAARNSVVSVDAALALFGSSRRAARARLLAFMRAPTADPAPSVDVPISPTLRRLVAHVCSDLGADPRALARGGRSPELSRARALAAHVACDRLEFCASDVAPLLGVTATAAARARRRGRTLAQAQQWRSWVQEWSSVP